MTTATDMRQRARTVWRVRGIPRMGTLSRAVNTSSRAEAKAFKIEFNFLRNKEVMIPRTELLRMRARTRVWLMDARDDEEKALARSP